MTPDLAASIYAKPSLTRPPDMELFLIWARERVKDWPLFSNELHLFSI